MESFKLGGIIMIRYIIGRSGSGKSHYILEEIKRQLSENKKVVMIVPEQFTLQAERDFIEKMDTEGMINLEVLSFERMSHMIFQEVRGLDFPIMDEVGRLMALKKIFDDNIEDIKVFKNSYNKVGFLREFSRLISEFKRNRINGFDLEYQIQQSQSQLLKGKIEDIKNIYEKFDTFIMERYIDNDDKFEILIESIKDWDKIRDTYVYVDGFNGLTKQEIKILEEVAKTCDTLNIASVFDHRDQRDYDLFTPTRNMLESIREFAARNGIRENKVMLSREIYNEEIRHLENNLYRYPFEKYEKECTSIQINSVQTIEKEVHLVAGQIEKLIYDEGYRFKDIAVVTSNMDTYENIIKRVFKLHGLKVFIDSKKNSLNSPIIKFILSYLKGMNNNFKRDDILNFLKTDLVDISHEDISLLENYSFEKGIRGKKWFQEFTDKSYKNLEEIEIAREKLAELYNAMLPVKKHINPKNFTIKLYENLINIGFEKNISKWLESIYEDKLYGDYNSHSQVWESVLDTLDQMVEILGEEVITLGEYINILEMGFQSIELGVIPATLDEILVGSIDRSKSHDIKALFIMGMNDGVIPSTHQEAGILVDDEKSLMIENNLPIKSNINNMVMEENLLIYQVMSKPKERLFLSYSQGDIEGKTIRGSFLIDRICMIFPEIKVNYIRNKKLSVDEMFSKESVFNKFVEDIRELVLEKNQSEMYISLFRWFIESGEGKVLVDGLNHSNLVDNLDKEILKDIYSNPLGLSISRLEKFVLCPFAHFVKYVLRPKTFKEYIVDYPDMGLLFHDTLEHFGKEMHRRNIAWDNLSDDVREKMIDSILNRIVLTYNDGILSSSSRYKYLSNKIKRVSRRAISTIFNQITNSDFKPIGHEIAFDDSANSGNIGPLILEDENMGLVVNGRIDRIDSYENNSGKFFRIIDYKSGSKEFSFDDLYYGLQMQLGIYSLAYKKNIGNDRKLAGTFYFRIDDPIIEKEKICDISEENIDEEIMEKLKMNGIFVDDIDVITAMDKNILENRKSSIINAKINKDDSLSKNSSGYSREELNMTIKYIEKKALELGKKILNGEIKISPCEKNGFKACDYCEYNNICQFDSKLSSNKYNIMPKISKDKAIELMKDKISKAGDNDEMD